MVDVSEKVASRRTAVASGKISISKETLALIHDGTLPKGNVVEVARIAGIQAAKQAAGLIPLCHPLPLDHVDVRVRESASGLTVTATASTRASTGVEMEALTAAAVALLTLYDMCKGVERGMTIGEVRLESKAGGRSGTWKRSDG